MPLLKLPLRSAGNSFFVRPHKICQAARTAKSTLRVIHPDGCQETHQITPQSDVYQMLKALIGGWIEYLPAHYHALQEHEVVIDEEDVNKGLAPNWIGSRLIGLDLTQHSPLSGPIVLAPYDPEDGPSPAQQRRNSASPDSMVNLYARALEGDKAALKALGVSRPDQLVVIDARPSPVHYVYLIHPDGQMLRRQVNVGDEAQEWIDQQLGKAHRLPPTSSGLSAYAVIYSAHPKDPRLNLSAGKALGLTRPLRGPVVLAPTGHPDPTHQRLDEALKGSAQARAELGLSADW